MISATAPLSLATLPTLDDAPRYSVEVETYSPTYAIVRAFGDLEMNARADLARILDRNLKNGADVVVDLSGVKFMYSGAANAVIDAASSTDCTVRIFAPTRPVRMILEVLGAHDLLVDSLPVAVR